MKQYNPNKIEKKWQEKWAQEGIYNAKLEPNKKKWYSLVEFPYPSGAGLHTGHIRSFTAMDIISRKRRMEGYNVLYPIGWDAFGLPTENYAIKTGISPQQATAENVATFKRQLQSLGLSFDWSREVNTTDPKYYRWTQWIFIKLFENGLAYKSKASINWCLSCKIGLANEEVVNGACERCGGLVEKREKEQWMLKITAYAEKLLAGLDEVDYLQDIQTQQKNWIGKSEGVEIAFKLKDTEKSVPVFTTRPETIFGATYLVLAPENQLVASLQDRIENFAEVEAYIQKATQKTEIERANFEKEKTGIPLKGVVAINPANQKEIPVWVSDYVLADYQTGAIMAVPAHDERDLAFAEKFQLEIQSVLDGNLPDKEVLVNSLEFTGLSVAEARGKITALVGGVTKTSYKLRDWVFSRQRYWGEPIPIIFCGDCGYVPVPEDQLPVTLPKVEKYQPRDDGESPLASVKEWVNVPCPSCAKEAQRETDVMPNWAGSSWYFLRYTDPTNEQEFASQDALKYFLPVDWYNGGMEHVTLHLLYSRFWNLFLHDLQQVPYKEPYAKRTKHGMILGPDGKKMSKSKGNVVNPDPLIKEFGADALRLYEMFMGPFDQMIPWDNRGILGTARFLEKVWRTNQLVQEKSTDSEDSEALQSALHATLKKVTEDIESMSFNTSVSQMMIFINAVQKEGRITQTNWQLFLQVLAPFAPHIAEELWAEFGNTKTIHLSAWPKYDSERIQTDVFLLVVQVNGKVRAQIEARKDLTEAEAIQLAKNNAGLKKWLAEGEIQKTIFVPNRVLNFLQ